MKRSDHRSHLFLTELVISLSLFVVCAAVCVALLVHARSMSRESLRLTYAVNLAQRAAEGWRTTGSTCSEQAKPNEQGLTVTCIPAGEGADISVYYGDELVYELKGVQRLE